MKHVRYKPNLSEWNIRAVEKFQYELGKGLRNGIEEVLHYIFKTDETYIYFPMKNDKGDGIGGDKVKDPLTVYLCVSLDQWGKGSPRYKFNLREALVDDIEACAEDGSFTIGLERISIALRKLADEIDKARKKGENAQRKTP